MTTLTLTRNDLDIAVISRALVFSANKHRKQRRKDKDKTPYINHPLEVFDLLVQAGVRDTDILAASILHDTEEDTDTTSDELREQFGEAVANYVRELTDNKQLAKEERKRLQVLNAPHKSVGAKQIKIADKINNISDLGTNPPADWTVQRRLDYLTFAEQVVAGCRGVNAQLEKLFDERLTAARLAIEAETQPA